MDSRLCPNQYWNIFMMNYPHLIKTLTVVNLEPVDVVPTDVLTNETIHKDSCQDFQYQRRRQCKWCFWRLCNICMFSCQKPGTIWTLQLKIVTFQEVNINACEGEDACNKENEKCRPKEIERNMKKRTFIYVNKK